MIKLNAKKIVRIATCPNCKNKVRIEGNPGEKIYVTCPQCSAKGFISFLKTESKRKAQTKEENKKDNLANNIAVKRVLAGGFISILAVFFLVYMFIPLILGSSHFLIVLSGSMEPTI